METELKDVRGRMPEIALREHWVSILNLEQGIMGAILIETELLEEVKPFREWLSISMGNVFDLLERHYRQYKTITFDSLELAGHKIKMYADFRQKAIDLDISGSNFLPVLQQIKNSFIIHTKLKVGETIAKKLKASEDISEELEILKKQEEQEKPPEEELTFPQKMAETLTKIIKWNKQPIEYPTSLTELDRILGGLHRSNLIVISGDSSVGKTAFAGTLIVHFAGQKKKVLFFCYEMSEYEIHKRFLTLYSKVNLFPPNDKNLSEWQIRKITSTYNYFKNFQIQVLTQENTISQIKLAIEKYKPDIIFLDYLQLMPSEEENRNLALGQISRGLKLLAVQFDIPFLLLSQITKSKEGELKLRDSGEVFHTADVCLFLKQYPKEKEKGQVKNGKKLIELSIEKNRNGARGNLDLSFDLNLMRFYGAGHFIENLNQEIKEIKNEN